MKFEMKQRKTHKEDYASKDIDLSMRFAKRVYNELGSMVSAVVIFGSRARKEKSAKGDLDILLILDDIRMELTPPIVEAYRIIIQKAIAELAKDKLHIQILHLTAWWGYVRAGDPIAINILRDGFALVDTGFFDPLQGLLDRGAIRPSEEAIWTYYNMAPASLFSADSHVTTATMDLYWAAIDSAHAALMRAGVIPPAPEQVADLLREHFVRFKKLDEKYAKTMEMFYALSKDIIHKNVTKIIGKEFDEYRKLADEFVEQMKKIVTQKA